MNIDNFSAIGILVGFLIMAVTFWVIVGNYYYREYRNRRRRHKMVTQSRIVSDKLHEATAKCAESINQLSKAFEATGISIEELREVESDEKDS